MSDQDAATATDMATLLAPMSGNKYLLLPGMTVAEVTHYAEPEPVAGAPEWLLGRLAWRTKEIPLVCFEAMNGDKAEMGPNVHVAVLNGSENPDRMPFYAIVTQATPRLLRLQKDEVKPDKDAKSGKMEQMAVQAAGEPATIPDVVKIEKAILDVWPD